MRLYMEQQLLMAKLIKQMTCPLFRTTQKVSNTAVEMVQLMRYSSICIIHGNDVYVIV